jgi:transcriptional regulator GlxA family with amidase domain
MSSLEKDEIAIMHIAIPTFDEFNERDSFIASGILNRVKSSDWKVSIVCSTESVTSMNGVEVKRQISLDQISATDVALVGSGAQKRNVIKDAEIMNQLRLDLTRQLNGAQCSGALQVLAVHKRHVYH